MPELVILMLIAGAALSNNLHIIGLLVGFFVLSQVVDSILASW